MDLRSGYVKCTPNAASVWGITEGPAEDFFALAHESDRELLRARAAAAIRDQRGFSVEYRVINPAGQVRWLHSRGDVFTDATGQAARFLGVSVDITERKRSEEAVRASEERLRIATQTGKIGVWEWDILANRVTWTDSLYGMHGVTREQFRPTVEGFAELVHPEDRLLVEKHLTAALQGTAAYELTFRARRPDGTVVWLFTNAIVLREQGKPVRMLGATTDVTELKTTELALAAAQEALKHHAALLEQTVAERTAKLRETVAELEHFSYTITHDMRAPLRAMQAFGQILRDEYNGCLDEKGADYLRRIIQAAQRMDNLITDSLNYAKAVQTELTLEPIDPGALLRGIVETYPQFQPPRAEIEVTGVFPLVLANPAGLTQCFSNLLGNAVKFVNTGQVPRVRVWAEPRAELVRLWVEDNGIGIPPEEQERVFVMFQRISKKYEGTGVGLALVRKVVEKMRGRVGFESEPGHGSRFWLELRRG
jgi:PAS domain S-box-containing protein